jgi:GcrA cell cycle regulator
MSWTDERVAELRALFAESLSAGAIAAKLGGVTRNAVIGKLGRLGLHLSPKVKGRPVGAPRTPRKRKPWQPAIIEQFPSAEAINLPPESATTPVTLMQLTAVTCRWPVSGDGITTLFCGAVPALGYPYCGAHCDCAYTGFRGTMSRAQLELRVRQMRKTRAA